MFKLIRVLNIEIKINKNANKPIPNLDLEVYNWADGSKFDGEWDNGLIQWDGEYIWENGKS